MRPAAPPSRFRDLLRIDVLGALAMVALMAVGVMFIYSAGREAPSLETLWEKQIGWVVLAVLLGALMVVVDYRRVMSQAEGLFAVALAVLILTLAFGTTINAARCWLNFFGILVQPSEFAKLAIVLMLARELGRPDVHPERWSTILRAGLIAAIPFGLIVLQPDFGTAAVILPVTAVMLFAAGVPLRRMAGIAGLGLLSLPVAWLFFGEYQKERVRVFLDPYRDPLGTGWNKIQSEIAVGSGGLWGKGWLEGTQNTLGYLPRPVAPTDFIYSVIAEEAGFLGSAVLLVLFSIVLGGCLRAAVRARDRHGQLLAAGVAALLFSHAFVNMAMTIGLLPITGIPLPLVSYGGSFMIAMGLALGLVQSVYARRRMTG